MTGAGMIFRPSNLSILTYKDSKYIQGPILELRDSIVLPYIKGQRIEFGDMKLQTERPDVVGVGDRFEEGCAFINLFEPYLMEPFVKELGLIFSAWEFLFKDITPDEWELVYTELKQYSKQDPDDIKIKALRKLIIDNKSNFPILYDNLDLTQEYHPDALLLLLIRIYELEIKKYGMLTLAETEKDSAVFAIKESVEQLIMELLPEINEMKRSGKGPFGAMTFGGAIHNSINPLLIPWIMENATKLLFGATLINICNYLDLTLISGTAEGIEANRHRFVKTGKNGIEYGERGYEFYCDILRKTPVGYGAISIINERTPDKIENRIILIYNDGQFHPPRDTQSKVDTSTGTNMIGDDGESSL
ncbi:hypothetical protein ACFLY8_05330 [Halobacteriota archaeon]